MSLSPARQTAEEEMAQRYAEGIRTLGDHTGQFWADLNGEIVELWSRTALQRIKRRGWQIEDEAARRAAAEVEG